MDLTAAVDAVKAHVAHETWCCAHRRGCPNPSQHVTLGDLDDGIIPEDVECPGECECLRSTTVEYIDEAVAAVAPLIEAAVRAKAAEEIDALHTKLTEQWADRVIACDPEAIHTLAGIDLARRWLAARVEEQLRDADHCDRGPCAAEAGHEGTCAEASGWADS